MSYASAWYVDTPDAVAALTAIGMNAFFVPATSETAVDAVLDALGPGQVAVIDLSGYGNNYTDPNAAITATAYVGHYGPDPRVAGFLLFDEPNNSGQSDAFAQQVQRQWYAACKAIAPTKLVYVNYAVGPTIPDVGCILTTPGEGWDQVCVDYYPDTYDAPLAQDAANLVTAAQVVMARFPAGTAIHWFQQAAGCSTCPSAPPWLRPIDGLLQTQYDILDAAGVLTVSKSLVYYGWGTLPIEDRSLKFDTALRTEAAAVIVVHKARHA